MGGEEYEIAKRKETNSWNGHDVGIYVISHHILR
jgi:hypothetical protein